MLRERYQNRHTNPLAREPPSEWRLLRCIQLVAEHDISALAVGDDPSHEQSVVVVFVGDECRGVLI